jgi:diaminopimelate epimerase
MGDAHRTIHFVKMTGAGNDFVLVDELNHRTPTDWTRLAPALCDRRYGIGADGLLILRPGSSADFAMEYYNADGSSGGMCGNGGRCAAYYFLSERTGRETTFEALGDSYSARFAGTNIILSMKDPVDLRSLRLELPGATIPVHYIDTGAPHAVIFTSELPDRLQQLILSGSIRDLGRSIRHHPEFRPGGTNVDFIELRSGGGVAMRSYERGVEEETLACGTGAVASAIISVLFKGLVPPVNVRTRSEETLRVGFEQSGNSITNVELEGPARIIYRGELELSTLSERGNNGTGT